jgi:hypothetical protein
MEHLNEAVAANGKCDPRNCWHFVAISKRMEELAPGERHMVKVDAGHIKTNYRGYHYIADCPTHVKRSLMLFDAERYEDVRIRQYKLRFRRLAKIKVYTAAEKKRINTNRNARIAAGGDERKRGYPSLRKRVEGFSSVV